MATSQLDAPVDEVFVLRTYDKGLADRLRAALDNRSENDALKLQLEFTDAAHPKKGELGITSSNGQQQHFDVHLQDLPTVVEAYKTYDDVNLVKIADVGQVLLVAPTQLHESLPEEALHGVTPPMQFARQHHFKPIPKVDPELVSKVEAELLALLNGRAPLGTSIVDYEEQFVVDEAKKTGSWQLMDKRAVAQAGAQAAQNQG